MISRPAATRVGNGSHTSGSTHRPVVQAGNAPHAELSDRQLDVLRLLARGLSVNDIAAQLAISDKTVSTHKSRLMEKLNFSSMSELVRYAVFHKLVG